MKKTSQYLHLSLLAALLPLTSCIIAITPATNPRPGASPSSGPTAFPTTFPTASPNSAPTASPSSAPTASPSSAPSASPSVTPSVGTGGFQQAAGCPEAPGVNLVSNPGFETPNAGGGYLTQSSSFDGWSLDAGSVDVVGTYWQAAAGNQSLDLSGASAGTVSQELATTAGQAYRLTLCMASNPNLSPTIKLMNVKWNGSLLGQLSFDSTGKSYTSMGWVSYTVILPASLVTGRSRLTLQSLADSSYGPAVDNVSVYPVTSN